MPATSTVSPTGDGYIDGMLYGTKWATTSLTFSFPTNASFYGSPYGWSEPTTNFQAFTSVQQAAVRAVFANYSAVANLTFTEVTETSTVHADLRYAESDAPSTAWAYYPSTAAEGGDAWFGNSTHWYDNPIIGSYDFSAFLHETGHALGLKHPHEAIAGFGAMPTDHDSLEYTVMSYRSYIGASTSGGYTNAGDSYPQTLMMYDIAAVQDLYGANYATNAGATVYSWNPTTGQELINGVAQAMPAGDKIFMTIWDGSGTDTYDFSNYSTGVSVDLRPGNWTTASSTQLADLGGGHFAAGNIANALLYNNSLASLIENAIGGSGNDTLIGNAANNALTGGNGNDSLDGQGGTNTAVYSGASTDYSVADNGNGTWTVTDLRNGSPDGTDTLANIQYLQFSNGLVAVGATVTNQTPVAQNDTYSTTAGAPLVIGAGAGVLANDTDADGNALSAVLVSGPDHGVLTLGANGSFTFTPDAGWSGTTSFSYAANDGSTNSNVATATITVAPATNVAPVAQDDGYAATAGTTLAVSKGAGVLANDSDANGDTLTASLINGPDHGVLALAADGSFTFTPDAGWSGTTSFTYAANDGTGNSNAATATITVAPKPNQAPVAVNDSYTAAAGKTFASINGTGILANDTDPNGDPLSAVLVSGPAHGSLILAGDGSFNFTPDAGWSGTTSFTYAANDGTANSNVATVTLNVNPPPITALMLVAGNDEYSVVSRKTLTVAASSGLLANDSDPNGLPMKVSLVKGPANGTVKVNPDGSFTFTPTGSFTGTTSFQYQVSDGQTKSVVATATIDVLRSATTSAPKIDQAIVVQNDTYSAVKKTTLTVDAQHGVLANDYDKDGLKMTASLVQGSSNGQVKLNADGSFSFTPKTTFTGTTSFTYKVTDAHGVSTLATATIKVGNTAAIAGNGQGNSATDVSTDGAMSLHDFMQLFGDHNHWNHDSLDALQTAWSQFLHDHGTVADHEQPDNMKGPSPDSLVPVNQHFSEFAFA